MRVSGRGCQRDRQLVIPWLSISPIRLEPSSFSHPPCAQKPGTRTRVRTRWSWRTLRFAPKFPRPLPTPDSGKAVQGNASVCARSKDSPDWSTPQRHSGPRSLDGATGRRMCSGSSLAGDNARQQCSGSNLQWGKARRKCSGSKLSRASSRRRLFRSRLVSHFGSFPAPHCVRDHGVGPVIRLR